MIWLLLSRADTPPEGYPTLKCGMFSNRTGGSLWGLPLLRDWLAITWLVVSNWVFLGGEFITSFSHFLVLFFLVSVFVSTLFSHCHCPGSLPIPLGHSEWLGGPWCLWLNHDSEWARCPQLNWGVHRDVAHRSRGQEGMWSIILKMENDWYYKQQGSKSKCTLLMKCQISTAYTALTCLLCMHDNRLIMLWNIILLWCTMLDFPTIFIND